MPPQKRERAGSRTGVVSPELKRALAAEAAALSRGSDAAALVRGINDFYAQLDHELEQFANVRLKAIADLRAQGMTYTQITEATGLSRTRVAQLARASQTGGRLQRR